MPRNTGFSARVPALHAHAGRVGQRGDQVTQAGSGVGGAGLPGNALGEVGSSSTGQHQQLAARAQSAAAQAGQGLHGQSDLLHRTGNNISTVEGDNSNRFQAASPSFRPPALRGGQPTGPTGSQGGQRTRGFGGGPTAPQRLDDGSYQVGSHPGADGQNYATYLQTHQNKHQRTKIGELGPWSSKPGSQFPAGVGLGTHQQYLGPNAVKVATQGGPDQATVANKQSAYLQAEQRRAESYQRWQQAQQDYNYGRTDHAAMEDARRQYLADKTSADARAQEYSDAQTKYGRDGYIDANGNYTPTPQHSGDGVRYQTKTDTTTNPPTVIYHAYPEDNAGGVNRWNQRR